MSFTDQKPRLATEHDLNAKWSGDEPGKRFRCGLCGYKFTLGDTWRWVYAGKIGLSNFIVCDKCDSTDILDKWNNHYNEAKQRFWYFID
jgi:hypothetical protein